MNRYRTILCAALTLLVVSSVAMASDVDQMKLTVTPGETWSSRMWIGPIPVKKIPQIAAWIETMEGSFVTTLTVSDATAKQKWKGKPEGGRPESLPVWTHATAQSESTDAISSASPKNGLSVNNDGQSLEQGKPYRIKLEINTSFDYNEYWTKKSGNAGRYSGVNGQPSLVYEVTFTAGTAGQYQLMPVGIGSVDGSSGEITPEITTLTSALTMIESAMLVIQ